MNTLHYADPPDAPRGGAHGGVISKEELIEQIDTVEKELEDRRYDWWGIYKDLANFRPHTCTMPPTLDTGKPYSPQCTGIALETVKEHTAAQDVTLYGQCFCPFTQRVWTAFEALNIPYKVVARYFVPDEVDHTNRPADFLEVSPKGLVPGLSFNNPSSWKGLSESSVMLEYLNDEGARVTGRSLLPPPSNPYARSLVRLQADHVSRTLVPAFFRYVFTQDPEAQLQAGKEWTDSLETLVSLFERAEKEVYLSNESGAAGKGDKEALRAGLGLWVEGNEDMSLADVLVAPCTPIHLPHDRPSSLLTYDQFSLLAVIFRALNVLKYYRDYDLPSGPKFSAYVTRLTNHPSFKKTCSNEDVYIDSYERYAFNRPNPNNQLQNAVNSGKGIP
ncbi:hypothetical protein AAF712_002749 [Marasmius tenuissimus]|uniref:GST N-terminal domain-containing protein n=1 Tax=Marasmius tenuissimus TaxID=585030 RepID=A0ABR3ACG1_9AGAR